MKSGVKVADVMSPKPVKVQEDTPIIKCARLMLKKKVGSLIVVRKKRLVGLLTEKDILRKVVAKNKDTKKIKAKEIMTKKLVVTRPDVDILGAMEQMKKKQIRRLPVVSRDRKLLGMLTMKDALNLQPHLYDYLKEKMYVGKSKMKRKKEKYIEGECESCGDYARLYEVDGRLLCEDCRDEEGRNTEADSQASDY